MNVLSLLTQTLPVETESGLRESLRLLDLPAPWVIVLVVLPAFAGVAWIGYAKEAIGTRSRAFLLTLRMAAFLLLALVLARPVRVQHREEVFPAEVLVLIDDSASMRRKDTYSGDPGARAAIEQATGLSLAVERTRLELARSVYEERLAPLLAEKGYDARLFGFAEASASLTDVSSLSGRGVGTHLGSALTQAVANHRGRNVSEVVVLSDGRSNGGIPVLEGARAAGGAGIPVHTVVVGDTRPERNVVVELVEAPSEALEGDELAVTVRVLGRGADEVDGVSVFLEELDTDGEVRRSLDEKEARLTENGERVVLVAPGGAAGPRSGDRRFRVSVAPLDGETMVDDNQVQFSVHLTPARMRVLYVDGYPRWEYRYLKNLLLRADQNLDVQCYLLSATPDFPQESSRRLPSLQSVPTSREALLANYDVIILGDVDPDQISHVPSQNEEFLTSVREFVEAGGGLLFQAGEWHNPRRYLSTPLKDVLPVVLDPTGVLAFEGDSSREVRPLLADPTNPHEILRLDPDPDVNRRLWEDPNVGLRGFFWYSPVDKAKPGATELLLHPEHKSPQTGEPYPLLVIGYYPQGRTMFLGLDSTWMWRYHYGDRYHETFWRNAIRWLALGRLKSGDRRYRIETPRATFDLEDRIPLEARALDEDFRPSNKPTQAVRWSGPDGEEHEVALELAGDRPGVYRGTLQPDRPGLYRAWIQAEGRHVSSTEFEVVLPSRENADPSPDPDALRRVAETTGGRALDLASVGELADEFPGGEERREPISSRLEDVWDSWTTLLVALGLLSAEWIVRKRVELV